MDRFDPPAVKRVADGHADQRAFFETNQGFHLIGLAHDADQNESSVSDCAIFCCVR